MYEYVYHFAVYVDGTSFKRTAWALIAIGIMLCAAPALACDGDCNGDQRVTVSELVTGVAIALDRAALDQCATIDRDGNGRVSVDELVAAVGSALGDCRQAQTHAFVVTTNFVAGSFATIALDEPRTVSPSAAQRRIHNDATARVRNGLVYVVNRRFGDNIQVLDPAAGFATRLQCSVGSGANPHDIAFVSDTKAYVTLFEESTLLIVNPAARQDCGDFVRGTIDLTALADDDGIPDMDLMAVAGDLLYVALQRLDIETLLRLPAENGAIAVIDTSTDTVIDVIELTGENPYGSTKGLTLRGGALYVAEAGLFGQLDGGIERVDLHTRQAEGFFVTEADLGGDIVDFVLISDRLGYAIVSRTDFNTDLIAFDPAAGRAVDTLLSVEGFRLLDIEANDRGELFLADRQRQRDGVRIFRASDGMPLVDEPIDLGLAPFEIIFLP